MVIAGAAIGRGAGVSGVGNGQSGALSAPVSHSRFRIGIELYAAVLRDIDAASP